MMASLLDSRMEAYLTFCILCVLSAGIRAQIPTVNCTPTVVANLAASITTNSVVLQQPRCCFNNLPNLTCTPGTCEVWLVSAVGTGVSTFDTNKNSPNFLSLSPYPSAFTGSNAKDYSLTKAGLLKDFPCNSTSTGNYFIVGADGSCSTTNCNGVLPQGSITRFKYLLVDPANKTLLAEIKWSSNITLYTLKDPGTISDGFAGRSGAMVVITTILSVAMALLLIFLIVVLALYCCRGGGKKAASVAGSFRFPHYDTHNLKDPSPYDNSAFEKERQYTTADTLPKSQVTTVINPNSQDAIKMQKM